MNLKELDSFKLSDAVTFHDTLNPKIWRGQNLRPEVKEQLIVIAQDFLSELGVNDLDVKDITVSGSNAAFSYTPHSDLDLHILVDMSDMDNNEIYKELFNAKKTIYNDSHDIKIHGVPVELYVQDAREPVVSLGEYSVLNDKWLRIPTKRRANFDQTATKAKYEKLLDIVKLALRTEKLDTLEKILKKIRQYRQAGLDKGGEFGPENLAYKALRSQGYITKLYALKDKLHSELLTIETMYQDPIKIQRDTLEEKLSKEFEDYDPNGVPPGPEFKPTMPAGTVKVDVSDVYDWYKLGQHISNMKGLGQHDFGQGPPSTILSFGDEDTEHKYIKDLEKTGLTTTDIDPVDPKQPKGMKRQKVDPTYNVNETFDQPYKLKWEKSDYGDVDAYAKLDDGNYLSIMFNKGVNQDNEEAWSVEFFRNNSQEVTGEGDAQRVFATVLGAIQTFIKKYKPNRIIFSASKDNWAKQQQNSESRASLYDRLVQRYARVWGFRAFRADAGDKVIYELNRINKSVKEDDTMQYAAEKTSAINPYGGLKDNQYRGSIAEVRKNPKQNIKYGSGKYELIGFAEDIRDKDNWAVSMTMEPKLGINPQAAVSEDTPKGIYFYPLRYFMRMADHRKELPWGDNFPYMQLFQYDRSGEMTKETKVDPAKLKQALRQYCPEEVIQQAIEDPEYDGTPYWFIYDCLSRLGKSDETNVVRWNKVLRDLGFTSVYDDGDGWIAYNEPTQGVVLDPRIIKQHKMFVNRNPTSEHNRYDLQRLADSIEYSSYYQRELQLNRIRTWDNPANEEKVRLAVAKSMLKPFLGKSSEEAKEMGYDTALKAAADKVIEILKQPINEASGYIPSEKEKNDPRFKTALTVDVKPDSIKKNAKAFAWLTDRAGIPPTANTNGKF